MLLVLVVVAVAGVVAGVVVVEWVRFLGEDRDHDDGVVMY